MAPLDDSLIGKTIDGKFRIVRHLGTGGMGTAFEASQRHLSRPVCLKFLESDALTSLDSVNRFKREARIVACWLHDEGKTDEAERYAKLAVSLLDGNPSIYNRPLPAMGWTPPERSSLFGRTLQRLAKWHTAEKATVQKLASAVHESGSP